MAEEGELGRRMSQFLGSQQAVKVDKCVWDLSQMESTSSPSSGKKTGVKIRSYITTTAKLKTDVYKLYVLFNTLLLKYDKE